ncbi:SDR family oxidoreductase [Leptospira noumeaensis]|uniref:SDR family oxidoreductase n=1 Tax=Leptospira noumeaensis TaxID=2484964 RepID=A0A4R9I5S2_9LEPT|nr:SDR family oxidoreductase [Leptospira noumeaensis]TGK81438.1 SDR family oxidoreductase [Leptospira noumeaensis]
MKLTKGYNSKFWKDKVVWITGASSGIGEALVHELKDKGVKLVLSARRKSELERVRIQAGLSDDDCLILPLDLEKFTTLSELPGLVIRKFGRVDVLINNGGISQRSLAHETNLSTYQSIMNINFFGNISLSLALLPYFQNKNAGHIVSIASIAGKFGVPFRTGYSASKFALTGFYEALRAENTNHNIKITLVYPGFIKTNISENAYSGDGSKHGKVDPGIEEGIDSRVCAKKIISAIEMGKLETVIVRPKEKFAIFLHKYFLGLFSKLIPKAKVV